MKKTACMLAVLAALSGCTAIVENTVPPAPRAVEEQQSRPEETNLVLYFLNESRDRLMPETRRVAMRGDANRAETALAELIRGPQQPGLAEVLGPGAALDAVALSEGVAEVYMRTNGAVVAERDAFVFGTAAANTLSGLLQVSFVHVFWDGVQMGVSGRPYGPFVPYTGDMASLWERTRLSQGGAAVAERRAVLYFAERDGSFMLPEVRNIVFTDENAIRAVVGELNKGPADAGTKQAALGRPVVLQDAEVSEQADGKTITLNISDFVKTSSYGDPESEELAYASLVYTLTGFFPGIRRVRVFADGEEITGIAGYREFPQGMRREEFSGLPGTGIQVYLRHKDSPLLVAATRTIAQSGQWDARLRLAMLFRGPQERDGYSVWPAIPSGVDETDILGVALENDTAVVDLSANFREKSARFSEESERLLVYSIVNTLCEISGVDKVRFLVEGRAVESLAGHLCLKSPLLKNPGLVKRQ